jgi:DNA-binding NtrC family response regulator
MSSNPLSILIVDDDQAIRRMIGILFRKDFIAVTEAENGLEGLEAFERAQPDLVLLDHDMPVMDGVTACSRMRQVPFPVVTPILMMTVHGDPQTVEAAFQAGVTDYIQKPPTWAVLQRRARHLAEKCRAEKQILQLKHIEEAHLHAREQEIENAFLVGSAKIFQNIMTTVELAATARAPVFITGETGTGKNMVAKAIHHHPGSTRGEFISLNCAAIPESLIEAELFGVEKGAYTGAVSRRKGAFELAHGGTLFLDEIGEMPLALQTKLLAILEDGIVKRLGGEERIPVDVRIIAATNVAPDLAVRQGKLRGDLFYRLNVIGLHLPPLRERLEDIPVLCRHFIRKLAPGRETEVPAGELELLGKYSFPGNVRELRNIIERCLILQPSGPIFPSRLLPAELTTGGGMLLPSPASTPFGLLNEIRTLEEVERDHIQFVYNQLKKNQTRTAQALGLALSTLKRKLKEVGVE